MKLVASQTPIIIDRHARRRDLGDQRQPDRREIELADGDDDEIGERARASSPCRRRRAAPRRTGSDWRRRRRSSRRPSWRRSTARGRAARLPRHSAMTNGVKAKIMNGLKAWNQVVGNLPVQNEQVDGAVGVVVGPQRDGVALLLVGRPEERHRQRQQRSARTIARHSSRPSGCSSPPACRACCDRPAAACGAA